VLGSAAVAFHFHELDYSILVVAAWLTLRAAPPLWHRLWLVAGVLPMQLMTYGTDSVQPIWNLAWHGPQLIWDAGWLAMLLASCFPEVAHIIDMHRPFASSPLLAWLFAPLTAFPEPVAYAVWTLLSLAALVLTWHLTAPYGGLAKATLLLLATGLWPVLLSFYFGQPIMLLLASVAGAWWLCNHDRPLAAGAALALATYLKPQALLLLPAAL